MKVDDLCRAMERIAPTRHAAAWDNVGLLVGDHDADLGKVLVCIDLTPAVWDEALALGATTIVAYHPPIFEAKKRSLAGDVSFDAARLGISIYSPHTALDAAHGGTNDVLADAIGMSNRKPLRPLPEKDAHYKLVTFVPSEALETVAWALGQAGAGVIGDYAHCTFRGLGVGTFLGGDTTNPVVGTRGVLQHAPEVRLEVVCPIAKSPEVVAALFASHPYETPAYDLVRLAPGPEKGSTSMGYGRVGDVAPIEVGALVAKLKAALGLAHVLVAGPAGGTVTRAAVGAGACGDMLPDVRREEATFFVLGEMRHHDALAAAKAGVTVVATLHSNSERKAMAPLVARLRAALPSAEVLESRVCADPFTIR